MVSYLLPLLIVAPLLPSAFAQYATAAIFLLLAASGLKTSTLFSSLDWKILELVLLSPGALIALYVSPDQLIRLVPIGFLILYYPYTSLTVSPRLLWRFSIGCLAYCFITQVALALGNPTITNFRDLYYPLEINPWNYGIVDSLALSFGEFRAGGLWRNPNVLAANIFLIYMTSYSSWLALRSSNLIRSYQFIKDQKLLAVLVALSIYLTGTRTYLFSLLLFWLLLFFPLLINFVIKGSLAALIIIPVIAGLFLFIQTWERFAQGFQSEGSLETKNRILTNYIDSISITDFAFGTGVQLQFDAEIGYWLGFGGIFAILAILLFYLKVAWPTMSRVVVVLPIIAASLGNTQMYGLMSASLLTVSLIGIYSSDNHKRRAQQAPLPAL